LATRLALAYAYTVSCHVLHPDEGDHDGAAVTEEDGFSYRILYMRDPSCSSEKPSWSGGYRLSPIPSRSLRRQVADRFPTCRHRDPIKRAQLREIASRFADCLLSLHGLLRRPPSTIGPQGSRARARLSSPLTAREQTQTRNSKEIAGIDAFTIARHFRWAFRAEPRHGTGRCAACAARPRSERGHSRVAAERGLR